MAQAENDIAADKEKEDKNPDLTLVGRFARYTSPFWQLVIPFLSARYLFEALDNLTDLNHTIRHWKDPVKPEARPKELLFGKWKNEGAQRWFASNILAIAFGSAVSGITGYYTFRTYQDIKKLYSEAIAYEFDKRPEDIKWDDIKQSKNDIVKKTMAALIHRSILRFGAASTSFIPWGILNSKKYHNTNQLDNVGFKMGTGFMGLYLFTDGFNRKESLFEALQEMVDMKINHNNGDPDDMVETADIEKFLNLHKKLLDKSYHPPARTTQEAQENIELSTYIADVMNQTYNNAPRAAETNFTVGKLVYLLGHGLLEKFPESMAYAALANKSKDMKEVQAVADAIKSGTNPETAFSEHGVTMHDRKTDEIPAPIPEQKPAARKFTDMVPQSRNRVPLAARTPQDFVLQENIPPSLGQ